VNSERVDVNDNDGNTSRVLIEKGPRTLRPNGKSTLELVSFPINGHTT
jgi:protoporphyrinogen/coproporphyrinogen III oxidase